MKNALRIVKLIPPVVPGTIDTQKVKVLLSLPITFSLDPEHEYIGDSPMAPMPMLYPILVPTTIYK